MIIEDKGEEQAGGTRMLYAFPLYLISPPYQDQFAFPPQTKIRRDNEEGDDRRHIASVLNLPKNGGQDSDNVIVTGIVIMW